MYEKHYRLGQTYTAKYSSKEVITRSMQAFRMVGDGESQNEDDRSKNNPTELPESQKLLEKNVIGASVSILAKKAPYRTPTLNMP